MTLPVARDEQYLPTVYVIDDDQAVRESMAWWIECHGFKVSLHDSAVSFLENFHVDMTGCIVLDIRMPGMDGLQLKKVLEERGCSLPTIFITGHSEVPLAIAAIRSGGFDFLEKPFDNQILLKRISEAMALEAQARTDPTDRQEIMNRIASLTAQEKRVLQRITTGMSNRQMANELGLSHKTIEVYRTRVMQKMKAGRLPELVRKLVENGLG